MKTILIIGGANDIGLSLVNKFKRHNYNVVVGFHQKKLNIKEIDEYYVDITNENSIQEIIDYCLNKYKQIDIVINLANLNLDNNFLDKNKAEFLRVLEVNLVGTFLLNKCYSKTISNGMIINMSSTDGIDTGSVYSIDYSASKAGIINMSQIISRCTTNKVFCICPNWIDSDTTKMIDKTYLDSELTRINQSRLITLEELSNSIYMLTDSNYESGSVFRIDVKDDKLWMNKIY